MSEERRAAALYQALLLEHARSPRYKGWGADADFEPWLRNPLCGDEVRLMVRWEQGRLAELACEVRGCAIIRASASIMSAACESLPGEELLALCDRVAVLLETGEGVGRMRARGDIRALTALSGYPSRRLCAALPWEALRRAVQRRS